MRKFKQAIRGRTKRKPAARRQRRMKEMVGTMQASEASGEASAGRQMARTAAAVDKMVRKEATM